MRINKKLSFAAAAALTSSVILTGCGGGGSSASSSATNFENTTITGAVTASKFKNAKVFLDLDFNAEHNSTTEPSALTNENGEFQLDYILDSDTEYLLVAQGNANTVKIEDNGTESNASNMLMFSNVTGGGEMNINPVTFQEYLQDLNQTLGGIDLNTTDYLTTEETNTTKLYADYVGNQNNDFQNILQEAANFLKAKNSRSKLESVKVDLGIDTSSTIAFSDANSSELAQQAAYKTQTTPAKIGNFVVSTTLQPVEIEVTTEAVDDTNITGVTAVDNNETAVTEENSIILKKPIFSVISDNSDKVKLILGNKSALKELGDITLSVTPYNDILTIPYYDSLKEHNVTAILGSDITVEDSKGNRIDVSDMVSKEISGVILDKHKADLNASELNYFYLDGTSWKNGGAVSDGGGVTLNSKFKLVPYIIAKTDDMQEETSIVVDGMSKVKNPVVVVKGKVKNNEATNSKILSKETDDDIIVLDATSIVNTDNNSANFKIPNGYEITEVVVIGDELDEFTEGNKNSVKVDVTDGQASIASELNLITNQSMIDDITQNIITHMVGNVNLSVMEAYNLAAEPTTPAETSTDTEIIDYILYTNNERFLGSYDQNTSNIFYKGEDINASNSFEIITDTQDENTEDKTTVTIDCTAKTITKTHTYKYSYTEAGYSGSTTYTDKSVFNYSNANNVDIIETISYSYSGSGSESGNYTYSDSISSNVTLKKIDSSTTQMVFNDTGVDINDYYGIFKTNVNGSVTYTRDPLTNGISQIQSGKIYQYLNFDPNVEYLDIAFENISSPKWYLNGVIDLTSTNISFTGDFTYPSYSYGEISGHAKIEGGTYAANGTEYIGGQGSYTSFANVDFTNADTVITTTHSYLANVTKFDSSWLNGKTLYSVYPTDNGWAMTSDTYTDTTINFTGLINETENSEVDYNITSNGAISLYNDTDKVVEYVNIVPTASSNDYLKVCWNDTNSSQCLYEEQEYLFLDKTKATNKIYAKKAEGSWTGSFTSSTPSVCGNGTLSMTVDGYIGNSWYSTDTTDNSEESGTAVQNGKSFVFKEYTYNAYEQVATGTMNEDGTSITGTWSDDGCSGTFDLDKSTGVAVSG